MRKHTPGPWRVGADCVGICVGHGEKSDYTRSGHAKTICKVTHASWADTLEHSANAKLIAAAPELLQALIDLYSVARVGRDEDYAAVTNAAVIIDRVAKGLPLPRPQSNTPEK